MSVAKLETLLRSLGWVPVKGDASTVTRAWKHETDERPVPDTIRVPRTDWVSRAVARRILAKATAVAFR